MLTSALHHVEMCVKDGQKLVSHFTDKMGFSLRATRSTLQSLQWVVRSQKSVFVLTERINHIDHNNTTKPPFTHFCCSETHKVDSVFNVAVEVKNVDSVTTRMLAAGARLHHPISEVEDCNGIVRYSIVGSCCGNIVHTLLDKSRYKGDFLPTFVPTPNEIQNEEPYTHIDHVTYVCHPKESAGIVQWYEDCLGMKKFQANPSEDPEEGLVIGEGIGMRLRVMDYWPCAETGVASPSQDEMDDTSLKIVIAESLPEKANAHISAFLAGHGGPGLQHIGLHSTSITTCVDKLITNGVKFRNPPAAYYRSVKKREEIEMAGYDVRDFQELGILIDSEADMKIETYQDRFLLQIFTLPLFEEETFFMEVVQRQGARGFGAGNVTALARSIEEDRCK